jgi:hypothetical protein
MALVKAQIPEGYATIRRSKSRANKLRCTSTSSNDAPQFEMIDLTERGRKYDSDILYNNHQNDIYDTAEVDEGVINDIDDQKDYFDDKKRTFETFKPRDANNLANDGGNNLSYELLMTPLKSPQYINQLNAMRNTNISNNNNNNNNNFVNNNIAAAVKQFPLYARPDSPKYGKFFNNNRSTSPSADSMDNCSSNSSTTYSPAYRNAQQHHNNQQQDDDNLIMIDNRKPPTRGSSSLGYRKSFSHITRSHHYMYNGHSNNNSGSSVESNGRKHNGFMKPFIEANSHENINSSINDSLAMPPPSIPHLQSKSTLGMSSISTSNLYTRRRFATLAHPKEKFASNVNTKSTSSLNESHVYWDPVLDSKIGSQTTLRTKPAIPWWEIACKKEYRQSCPPMQVNIYLFHFIYDEFF